MLKSTRSAKKLVIVASLLFIACSSEQREQRDEPQATQGHRLEGGCAHGICASGIALDATCDPCAATVCAADPWCCSQSWDATCVSEVTSICGQTCTAPPADDAGPSTCVHPICATGTALASTCDACVTQLCAQDAYCCAVEWDATCVSEVTTICGQACN